MTLESRSSQPAENPSVDACGGDLHVMGPVEAGNIGWLSKAEASISTLSHGLTIPRQFHLHPPPSSMRSIRPSRYSLASPLSIGCQ
jgi:hypothetical protein